MVCKEDIVTVAAFMNPGEYCAIHFSNKNGLASPWLLRENDITVSVVIFAVPISQSV
jgi:hypothetical protein